MLRQRAFSQGSIRKRLIKGSSEDKNKDLMRTSTAVSFRPKLQRMIQQGNLAQILNTDPHSKANIFYTTNINQMEKQLAITKKSLATMVLKSKSKEYSINKVKNEIQKIERESQMIRREVERCEKIFEVSKDDLQSQKQRVENNFWNEKIYKKQKSRLSSDQQLIKIRHNMLQDSMQNRHKEYKMLENRNYQLLKVNRQLQKILDQAKNISKLQTDDKNQFIQLLNQDLIQRDEIDDLRKDKDLRETVINQLAGSLIQKEQLQKYMQILYTHRLLNQIIKYKSTKLLKNYDKVQNAYLNIKSNINITAPNKIISKMEAQDSEYDTALKRVADLEKQVLNLEKQIQKTIFSQHQIFSKQGQNIILKKDSYKGRQKDRYEQLNSDKQKQQQKKVHDEVMIIQIQIWARKYFQYFGIRQNTNSNFQNCLKQLVHKIETKVISK